MDRESILGYAADWADAPAIDYVSALELAIAEQGRIMGHVEEVRGSSARYGIEDVAHVTIMQMAWVLSEVYGIDFDTVLAHVQV